MRTGRTAAFTVVLDVLRGDSAHPMWRRLTAVPRLLRQGTTGRYAGWDRRRAVLVVVGLLYVVSPVDLVPELLLGPFGLTDDAVLLAWLTGAVLGEVDSFLDWEHSRERVVSGDVVS